MVSGSVPTPTLAFSVLKSALIVELLPTPVAPVIIRLIFCFFKFRRFFISLLFSSSGILAFRMSDSMDSKNFFSSLIGLHPHFNFFSMEA